MGIASSGEARMPLGISVVGGMVFSTFLTLILVPVVYTFLARFTAVRGYEDREATAKAQPQEAV